MPGGMATKGGVFMPIYQREAMWMNFKATSSFAIKIYCGGVNGISGESPNEDLATSLRRATLLGKQENIQDYIVVEPRSRGQLWLDGTYPTLG